MTVSPLASTSWTWNSPIGRSRVIGLTVPGPASLGATALGSWPFLKSA